MENISVVFAAPYKVDLVREPFAEKPGRNELLVKKLCTLISTGTELACLSGGEAWFSMPATPGYVSVSEVLETGEGANFAKGDMIYHYGSHSLYQVIKDTVFLAPLPGNTDPVIPVLTRMATIAMTAIRTSDIELGDYVLVIGLGLVGNMAAQLAALSGARVIGVDPSPARRQMALDCGIAFAVSPEEAADEIMARTNGKKVNALIEATGIPKITYENMKHIGYMGEMILLGSPRGDFKAELADVLNYAHLNGRGNITIKGAHEWRYPVFENPFVKHSIMRNTQIVFDLLDAGKLAGKKLISHMITPDQAPETYLSLHENRNDYMGVVIDWRNM